ncbi:ParB/RepB/Spo0J family partition protein [Kitasatospora sp. NPDC056783]|uniref:ParB/RepB/Spo0J family partition protein n=1 Tax=Kitasatospora sp. NPDC056783 TaxID=3345943 RepID=UPI00367A11F4
MAGRRVSFASMAADPVVDAPGVEGATNTPAARWIPTASCLPNPRNPRDELGDLSDLASIKDRQLQSCLAVTPEAYLRLWPEDRQKLGAGPEDVIVVNGNRRRAAAELYGREQLLVVVDDSVAESKATLLRAALDENMARKDFDPIEEANAVLLIVAQYPTAKEAAEAEGWSQSWISHRKNLLKLHPDLQRQVRAKARGEEGVSINVARRLGSVKGIDAMSLAEQAAELEQLLQADAEAVVARRAAKQQAKAAAAAPKATVDAPAPQPAAAPAPAPVPAAQPAPATPRPEPAPEPAPAPRSSAASPEPAQRPDRFSAENSESVPMPEQRVVATPSDDPAPASPVTPATPASSEEELGAVDWHNVEELADAICRTLSADEAYRLADALANRLLTTGA